MPAMSNLGGISYTECVTYLDLRKEIIIFDLISNTFDLSVIFLRQLGVNFVNVKRTNFLYECRFGSFFLVTCS